MAKKFTSLKQVKDVLFAKRKFLGYDWFLHCQLADGPKTRRLYFLDGNVQGPLTAKDLRHVHRDYEPAVWMRYVCRRNEFKATEEKTGIKTWVQGGLDRDGVIAWANIVLAEYL